MRKIAGYVIIIFQILLIVSLIRGIYQSLATKERIERLEKTKASLEQEKGELGEKLEEVQSAEYLERVAREELHLAKPGEKIVIIPEELRIDTNNATSKEEEGEIPNWQKWWRVVSGQYWK